MINDINFLRNCILFSELKDENLTDIFYLLESEAYPEKYTIFFQGEEGDRVYFLKSGKVKVVRSTPEGDEQILEFINPGEVFGEVVLFGFESYPATTRTMEEVEVYYLSRSKFKRYFENHPEIGWGMLKVMAYKLFRSQRKIENMGLKSTKGRIANFIMEMLRNFGDTDNNFYLNFNQQELADYIGTSRETVSRTLSQLKKEGIINIQGNKVSVLDLKKLKAIM